MRLEGRGGLLDIIATWRDIPTLEARPMWHVMRGNEPMAKFRGLRDTSLIREQGAWGDHSLAGFRHPVT